MIESKDFFRNLKPSQIPQYDPNIHCYEQNPEVLEFWKEEYKKCRDGVIIDGIPIHGIIYYYINHYRTSFELGKITLPDFRDTEWFFNELFLEAEGKFGIFAFGSRRIGKTGLISCMLDWGSTFFFNSQNYFVYGEEADRNTLGKYLEASLTYKTPAFNVPILKGKVDRGKEISFGVKLKGSNKSYKQSTINFINTENGSPKGSLKAAGGTPKTWVYDEGGKYPLKSLLKQARPAWRTNQGELRCLPMIVGTGGDAEMSVDAFEILQNPESFGFLNMNWDVLERGIDPEYVTWKRKNFGFFLPAQISLSGKKNDSNLGSFLEKDSENLKKIDLQVTDWKESYRIINDLREQARGDQTAYNGEVMGYPFDTDEPFLFSEENPFIPNELKQWKGELIAMGEGLNKMDIRRDGLTGELTLEPSDKDLIVDYPFKGRNHDAPVVIYEPPPEGEIPMYTYVMGIDPYKYVDSSTDSVGSCYVYKRFNGMGETRDILVASYSSRPKDQDGVFHETCLRLAEIYNARIIAERNDEVFIKYVVGKRKEHLFERETGIQGMLRPDSKNSYTKLGVYVTAKEKDYMLGLVKKYITEEIDIDENGNPMLGYRRIKDLMLLEELIMYRSKANVDRIVAFGLALLGEDYFSKVGIIPKEVLSRKDGGKKETHDFKYKMISRNSVKFKHKWKK